MNASEHTLFHPKFPSEFITSESEYLSQIWVISSKVKISGKIKLFVSHIPLIYIASHFILPPEEKELMNGSHSSLKFFLLIALEIWLETLGESRLRGSLETEIFHSSTPLVFLLMTTHRNWLMHKGKITIYPQKKITLLKLKKIREIIKRKVASELCYITQKILLKSWIDRPYNGVRYLYLVSASSYASLKRKERRQRWVRSHVYLNVLY